VSLSKQWWDGNNPARCILQATAHREKKSGVHHWGKVVGDSHKMRDSQVWAIKIALPLCSTYG